MYDVFSLPAVKMPAGFLWGSATAGHQIEGDNVHSQWWAWEQTDRWKDKQRSGKACNHWELYKDDAELIAALGQQAYRLSVEWSRIEPQQGRWDRKAVARYVDLLERLKAKGIKLFVTLHHFTHPQWFEELGAFNNAENLKHFERFVSYIVPKIASLVDGWCVINEFNLGMDLAAGRRKLNFLKAHARGYHIIKQNSRAPVSSAHACVDWFPRRRRDQLDNVLTGFVDWITHEFFFHAIRTGELVFPYLDAEYDADVKGACDYWAVNYYTRHMVDARCKGFEGARFAHKTLKLIPRDFYLEELWPEGLITWLERLKDRPIYITENGCACNDDRWRLVYLALHFNAIQEAITRGVDVLGYFHWSLMDNYEWGSFVPRFGLVHVDFETFQRTPKPSAAFYRDVIAGNGFDQQMLRRHLKELPTL